MTQHAAVSKATASRSPAAEAAYREGLVTTTLDLANPPRIAVKQRTDALVARNTYLLSAVALVVWGYDLVRFITR